MNQTLKHFKTGSVFTRREILRTLVSLYLHGSMQVSIHTKCTLCTEPSPALSLCLLSSLRPCLPVCSSQSLLQFCAGWSQHDEAPHHGLVYGFEPFPASTPMSSSSDGPFEELCNSVDPLSRTELRSAPICARTHFIMLLRCCLICNCIRNSVDYRS